MLVESKKENKVKSILNISTFQRSNITTLTTKNHDTNS